MRKKLIILAVIVVVVLIVAISFFNLPQRIGLTQTPTEKMLYDTPDREAAAALEADLQAAGINTDGMELYVFPLKESEGNYAAVVLDESAGFDFRSLGSEEGITRYLAPIAELGENEEYDIERVAVSYKDKEGNTLLILTAPTEAINDFADGSLSREEFLTDLDGKVNYTEVVEYLTETLR